MTPLNYFKRYKRVLLSFNTDLVDWISDHGHDQIISNVEKRPE